MCVKTGVRRFTPSDPTREKRDDDVSVFIGKINLGDAVFTGKMNSEEMHFYHSGGGVHGASQWGKWVRGSGKPCGTRSAGAKVIPLPTHDVALRVDASRRRPGLEVLHSGGGADSGTIRHCRGHRHLLLSQHDRPRCGAGWQHPRADGDWQHLDVQCVTDVQTYLGNAALTTLTSCVRSPVRAVVFSFGHVSGAHFNPAVTVAVFVRGKISAGNGLVYFLAQFAGAFSAAILQRTHHRVRPVVHALYYHGPLIASSLCCHRRHSGTV